MKILHTADIHLGVKYNKLPKDKSALLREEMVFNIQEFFESAKDYDVILICGDLFHSKLVTQKIIRALFNSIKNFSKPVIFIEGNHDERFVFDENLPENFIILEKTHNHYKYNGVNFYCAGEIDELNTDETNILLLHGNIENPSDNDFINLDNFVEKGFDYIALGHVHDFKQIKRGQNLLAYSGSLFSNGFDECGNKGFIELDTNNHKIEPKFVKNENRRFMICNCDITGQNDYKQILSTIKESLEGQGITKRDLVRVQLKGKITEECDKSIKLLQEKLSDYFYLEIEDKTTLAINLEKIKNEKLSFKYEFIKLVEESQFSEEQKRLICQLGIEALKGEDLSI